MLHIFFFVYMSLRKKIPITERTATFAMGKTT